MQDRYLPRHNRRRQILVRNAELVDQDGNLVTRIPTQAEVDAARRNAADQQVYDQALRVLMTTETDRRMRYISASMIVSVLGGWLAGQAMRTRAFIFVLDTIVFLFSITMAGLMIGLLIGFGVLPLDTLPALLIIGTLILLVVAIVLFGAMMTMATKPNPPQITTTESPEDVDYVVVDDSRPYRYRVNRR